MSEHVIEVTDSSFEKDVLQSDKPVLVDFWAVWCGPCRMLAPIVEAVAAQYQGVARFVKLNVDDNATISQRFGINSFPERKRGGAHSRRSVRENHRRDNRQARE